MIAKLFIALLTIALLFSACSSEPPVDNRPQVDRQTLATLTKQFNEFAAALRLVGSPDPKERAKGLEQAGKMAPFQVFWMLEPDDQHLVAKARAGDDAAVRELARRGDVLEAVKPFFKAYDKRQWDAARKLIVEKGEDMASFLAGEVLIARLLRGVDKGIYGPLRMQLVAIGEPARQLVIAQLVQEADAAADLPGGPWEQITELTAALIGFGDKGTEGLQAVAASPKVYVRLCAARAVAETRAIEHSDIVVRLLREDPAWEVRMEAAAALGALRARDRSWKPLLEALERERDRAVLEKIVLALERSDCVEAVPLLVEKLRRMDISERVQEALRGLTGQRLVGIAAWESWYREQYPVWKAKRSP